MEDILIENRGYYKVIYNPKELYVYIEIEYNTDTSARHPIKDDDIVRYSFEKRRVKDKEP